MTLLIICYLLAQFYCSAIDAAVRVSTFLSYAKIQVEVGVNQPYHVLHATQLINVSSVGIALLTNRTIAVFQTFVDNPELFAPFSLSTEALQQTINSTMTDTLGKNIGNTRVHVLHSKISKNTLVLLMLSTRLPT